MSQALSQEAQRAGVFSRRQLLKALIAAGGTAAASAMLPAEWCKPVVEVGVLPVHAQISPAPVDYTVYCDSTPGGGDITLGAPSGTGAIAAITATLVVTSGSGPIGGVVVTMSALPVLPVTSLPAFTPSVPQTATTDASGVASFGDLDVNGRAGESFNLQFSFNDPVNGNPYSVMCGQYDLH